MKYISTMKHCSQPLHFFQYKQIHINREFKKRYHNVLYRLLGIKKRFSLFASPNLVKLRKKIDKTTITGVSHADIKKAFYRSS